MTHILVNPEFSRLYGRSKTVDAGILKHKENKLLTLHEFDEIRSKSRESWLINWEDPGKPHVANKGQLTTTYNVRHKQKPIECKSNPRPVSPTRRNNPHPSRVFLHLRVSEKDAYQPSKFKQEHEQHGQHPIYTAGIPQGTMYYTLKEIKELQRTGRTETLRKIMNFDHPGNRTWLDTPREGDRLLLTPKDRHAYHKQKSSNIFKPVVVPSLHRWLKPAGKEEKNTRTDLFKNNVSKVQLSNSNPDRYTLYRYETSPRVTIRKPYKTDFVIHPEFTSS